MQLVSDSATKPAKTNKRRPPTSKATLHVKTKSTEFPAAIAKDVAMQIATAAYYLAEQRGFAPGHELDDWLAAERQVLKLNS